MHDRRKLRAYLTVEASLLIPFVIAVLLTVVYLALYMYDRCLLYQDGWCLAIYVSGSTTDQKTRDSLIQNRISDIETEHYIAWRQGDWTVKSVHGKNTVSAKGSLVFPTAGWNLFADTEAWEMDFKASVRTHSMRDTLRVYKAVEGVVK